MKDNLIEMLLNLFEKSLTQLRKSQTNTQDANDLTIEDVDLSPEDQTLYIQPAKDKSTRIFTYEEQMKMTKSSYQFLMRMKLWNIIDADTFELIMNQFQCSDSNIINLQETKWTIRNILSTNLNEEQLAFLDLVLYQTEDELTVH